MVNVLIKRQDVGRGAWRGEKIQLDKGSQVYFPFHVFIHTYVQVYVYASV